MLNVNQITKSSGGKYINGNKDSIIFNFNIDSRTIKEGDFFIPLVGEKSNAHNYIIDSVIRGASGYLIESSEKNKIKIIKETLIINKDIVIIEVENTKESLYEMGKYNRTLHMNIPIIAITGSVGKTTTREIISSIFSKEFNVLKTYKNYNGDIGLPLMLLKLDNQDIAILEHGIDHLGEMKRLAEASKPEIVIVTMIGTSHIALLGDKKNIYKEKMQITEFMPNNAAIILNNDDEYLKEYKNNNFNILKYSIKDVSKIEINENETKFNTSIYNKKVNIKINYTGIHHIYNGLAAIKVSELFKIKTDNIIFGIEEYKNETGRFETILLKNNIKIIDDTYNASIDSMKSGIESIQYIKSKRKILVLGDMLELGKYTEELHSKVGIMLKENKVDILYTLGENSKHIVKNAREYVNETKEFDCKKKLIKYIIRNIEDGDLLYFKASNAMNFHGIILEIKNHLEKG